MGLEIIYNPKDDSFKSFRLYIETESNENNEGFKVKLVNHSLGLESTIIEFDDNAESIDKKIEKDLQLSWTKIVEEYDDSKLIFKKLEKMKNNLINLKK
ncbi:MAG: hypothetical protein ACTHKF_05700 [Candidatus Nitrosocosmicus sp.]